MGCMLGLGAASWVSFVRVFLCLNATYLIAIIDT